MTRARHDQRGMARTLLGVLLAYLLLHNALLAQEPAAPPLPQLPSVRLLFEPVARPAQPPLFEYRSIDEAVMPTQEKSRSVPEAMPVPTVHTACVFNPPLATATASAPVVPVSAQHVA